MIFSHSFTIETKESKGKVLEKLQKEIDNKLISNEKSKYKGEFGDGGFVVLKKGGSNYYSEVVIFGKLEREPDGTKIILNIRSSPIAKIIFWFLNIFLCVKLIRSMINSTGDWSIPFVILCAIWLIGFFVLWINTKWLKRFLLPLFK